MIPGSLTLPARTLLRLALKINERRIASRKYPATAQLSTELREAIFYSRPDCWSIMGRIGNPFRR